MSEDKKGTAISGSLFSAGGVILVLFILIFVNLIFSQVTVRWDATADDLYSLSEGTREILSDLDREVTIKVFYSRDAVNLPVHIKTYARRLLDFLSEYESYSDGRVTVETYNPEPDSEEEDWARKYGIEPINLATGERIYFGLVAMSADQEETIPSIDPSREEQLEYDITRLIARVQSADKPKIGIITALPIFGGPPPMGMMQNPNQMREPWVFISELRKTYEVVEIPVTAEEIEADLDLLILFHAKGMGAPLAFAVDQYVLAGGNAVVFADPFSVSDSAPSGTQHSVPEKLFRAWGVSMAGDKVVLDLDYATKLRNRNNQVEENPLWLSVPAAGFNKDDVTTAKLESLLMPVAGAIEKREESTYDYEPLIQSSANSSLTESFRARFPSGDALRRDFSATADTYDLAARVRGTFQTAFPDGKPEAEPEPGQPPADEEPEEEEEEEAEASFLKEGTDSATVVLVADADLLFDGYYVSRQNFLGFDIARIFNDNLNFLLNTIEILTGSDALITIRSRGKFERPFTKVEELERKAQARWLAREQELVRKVEETNRKLRELEGRKDGNQEFIISAEQEAEIEKFQREKQRINQELKEVRRNLRKDIEALGTKVKFVNIFLMPMLVAAAGLGYAFHRRKKSQNR